MELRKKFRKPVKESGEGTGRAGETAEKRIDEEKKIEEEEGINAKERINEEKRINAKEKVNIEKKINVKESLNVEESVDRAEREREGEGEEARDNLLLRQSRVPDGLFRKCGECRKILYEEDIRENAYCCPKCGRHFRIDPVTRLRMVTDRDSFREWDRGLTGGDPLHFPGYQEKLERTREKTGLSEGILTGEAAIWGSRAAIGIMSPDFFMGSMGTGVGERITRLVERAEAERLPLILFCCSGGARMQEGICSLMQMAKTTQALKRFDEAGLLYISVLTDPTMGGVTASFAMLGDVILAEPGAMIGFAGARVIRQTIGQKLPEGFQSAEFLQKHGFVDRVVPRDQMRRTLGFLLRSHALQ